jgi:7-cyano-7-deazaguanine synthase in queuosine biosynthesis
MPEALVVDCGPGEARRSNLRLDVNAPEGSKERVSLRIDHITRRMASNIPPRLVDLLEIAAYVYSADQLATRGGDKMVAMGRDWRRDFRFLVPVRDLDFWRQRGVTEQLVRSLSFLSDDYYRFDFREAVRARSVEDYLDFEADGPPAGFQPDGVALFSGGLDSLAGVAATLLHGESRLALVSHYASTKIQSRQTELATAIAAKGAAGRFMHVGIRVTRGQEEPRDFTQRTRSFLFASLAFVVAWLFRKDRITFFENGVTSVNLPLAEHVLGSRATRTTHPRVLSNLGQFFSTIAGSANDIVNPFFWLTKTEVVQRLAAAGAENLIGRSFSCSHTRLVAITGRHCGVCTQCLERRFAVLASGLADHDPADNYQVDLLEGERTDPKGLTLAECYVLAASRYAEMTETAFLAKYGGLSRVLPHLQGDMAQNATKLYELHRRHGSSVRGVIDRAFATMTVSKASSLPKSCLLTLVHAPYGSPAIRADPIEVEPTAAEQAQRQGHAASVERIAVYFDRDAKAAVFGPTVRMSGVAYALLSALADQRFEDHTRRRPTRLFASISAAALSERLGLTEESLRQQVLRVRHALRRKFSEAFDIALGANDVIENCPRSGYRLASGVAIRSSADPIAPNVTMIGKMSRSDRKDRGIRPSEHR